MEPKKQFSRIGLMMLLATIIINGLQYLSIFIAREIPQIASSTDLLLLAGMLPGYFIGYPVILYLFKKIPAETAVQPRKMRISHIFVAFLMTYAITYISSYIGNFLISLFEKANGTEVENVVDQLLNQIHPATTLLVAVILAPIFEELLFRKAVLDRTAKYGEGISIVFCGLLFGLFHGNFSQFAYAFCLGMFFGFIYLKTKKIIYPIILHILTNFMGSTVPMFVLDKSNYAEYEAKLTELMNSPEYTDEAATALSLEYSGGILLMFGYLLVMLSMFVAGVVLLIVKRKKFTLNPGELPIEKNERLRTLFFNPGMILFTLFWVAMIVMQLFGI